jgi:hypothetical protein
VPSLSRGPPVASRVSLSGVWIGESVAGANPLGVWPVRAADIGHRGDDFPGHTHPLAGVVPRHVVGDDPEEWGERFGTAARAGVERV